MAEISIVDFLDQNTLDQEFPPLQKEEEEEVEGEIEDGEIFEEPEETFACEIIPDPALRGQFREPERGTKGSVGYDLYYPYHKDLVFYPNEKKKVKLGFIIADMPENMYFTIESRSGLACLRGMEVLPAGAIIDPDYRKPITCYMKYNVSGNNRPYVIKRNDRIAQLVPHKKYGLKFRTAKKIKPTQRCGGYGSTGK